MLSLPSEVTASGPAHKPKIARTRFSIYQKVALENSFLSSLYLTGEERDALAFKIGLPPIIVQVNKRWHMNLVYYRSIAQGFSCYPSHPTPTLNSLISFFFLSKKPHISYKTERTSMFSLTTFGWGFFLLIFVCLSRRLGSKTGDLNGVKNSRWLMELTRRHHHYFSSPIPLPWHIEDLPWGLSTSSLVGREAHVSFV